MKQLVLHIRASNFVGGPEKQILGYAACNFGDQIEVRIASFCSDFEGIDLLHEAANRGIGTLALPANSFTASIRTLLSTIRESNVRLICTHGYKPAVIAAIASRLTRVPYVCFLRGWTKENHKVMFYESLEKVCARAAHRVVCLSNTQALEAKGWLDESRIRVVVNAARTWNNPLETYELKQQLCDLASFHPSRPLIVAAGRLSPEKGTVNLLRAAKNLQLAHPEIQFAIFGDGPAREDLQQQSRSLGLDEAVHFVGHQVNFAEIVAGADLLVNPSLTEQMPNVVLEAMSVGVPVLATAVGGVPELARDGAIALVAPGDANALAKAIIDLISSPSVCLRMIQKARERLQQDFSPEKQANQLKSLYSEFIALGTKSRAPSRPRISVVIPVRNEEQHIATVLNAVRNQDYPPDSFEIVVADGMSTDRTPEIVAEYSSRPGAPIRLVHNPARLSSCGRNLGVSSSSGDIIIFVDGHCHISNRNLLLNVSRLLEQTGADILCRPQPLECPTNSDLQKMIAAARGSWLGHGRDSTIYATTVEGFVDPSSAGAVYRRRLFEEFGGFDEKFDACEDVEFNNRLHRAGISAYISPDLTIFYQPRPTLSSLFSQMVRYGKGRVRLMRKCPESLSFNQLAPLVLMLAIGLSLLAAFTPFRYFGLSIIGVYSGIIIAESIRIAKRSGEASLAILVLTFIAIHAGLGFGMILEGMTLRNHGPAAAVKLSTSRANSAGTCGECVPQASTPQRSAENNECRDLPNCLQP